MSGLPLYRKTVSPKVVPALPGLTLYKLILGKAICEGRKTLPNLCPRLTLIYPPWTEPV
jgi:hypothetical protein